MEPLQHDPRTKQQIKDTLYASIYDPVQEKFAERLEAIITKNTALSPSPHRSFVYRRKFYSIDSSPKPLKLNRLHPSLYSVMDEYLADLAELNDVELPYVLGYINQVLNSSNSFQDYLRLLPESMHPVLENFINTCPCQTRLLSEEKVQEIATKNQSSIELMKKRLVLNLLL